MGSIIKVLIVDDSSLVRSILKSGLERFGDIKVIATASDPYEARDCINRERPDVVTLDIEMPKMNGIEFLQFLMNQVPIPVIMVSSYSERGKQVTIDALSYGALDFVTKPQASDSGALTKMLYDLHTKIVMASKVNVVQILNSKKITASKSIVEKTLKFRAGAVVAIGASTGGTEAIREIVPRLPKNFPPVLIVQHMPAGFTALFASRLNDCSEMSVREAVNGETITSGNVYVAPGGIQMGVSVSGGNCRIQLTDNKPQNGHCPSVGYLFDSLKPLSDLNAVLLTGMGKDGAVEMTVLKEKGIFTIAQNEETSVVYGMPREAIKRGGATAVLPLTSIAETLIQNLKE